MIEIMTKLLICPFIEFLNIWKEQRFDPLRVFCGLFNSVATFCHRNQKNCGPKLISPCFSVISVPQWLFIARETRGKMQRINIVLTGCYLHIKLRSIFKKLCHLVVHFKPIVHR